MGAKCGANLFENEQPIAFRAKRGVFFRGMFSISISEYFLEIYKHKYISIFL